MFFLQFILKIFFAFIAEIGQSYSASGLIQNAHLK